VFERRVTIPTADGAATLGRIDLYKRGRFVPEAKQSRQPGGTKELTAQYYLPRPRTRRHRKRVIADHPHLTLTGLYNVLEKLRAGTAPDVLAQADRHIFDDALVLILKELHEQLDAAVAAAYGWPTDLSDNEILARLVALNPKRVREEAGGQIQWLRPEYQIPRFGTARDRLALTGGAMREVVEAAAVGPKPGFPARELEQPAAVLAVLASATAPVTAAALAGRFRQGRRVLPQVEAVLGALVGVGGLVHSPDGGRSFLPRRAT
jgi:hypothetical protein